MFLIYLTIAFVAVFVVLAIRFFWMVTSDLIDSIKENGFQKEQLVGPIIFLTIVLLIVLLCFSIFS